MGVVELKNVVIPEDSIKFYTSSPIDNGIETMIPISLMQYDSQLAVVAFTILEKNTIYKPSTNMEINVRFSKPDGKSVYGPTLGTDDSGVVYFQIRPQMTAAYGEGFCCLELKNNLGVKYTKKVPVYISENPVSEDDMESSDEFISIQQIYEDVKKIGAEVKIYADSAKGYSENAKTSEINAKNSETISVNNSNKTNQDRQYVESVLPEIQNAEEYSILSKSWAVGGTNSRDDEEVNNSKYWAEQAMAVSNGYLGYFETKSLLDQAYPTGRDGDWAIIGETDTIWVWDSDTGQFKNSVSDVDLSDYYTKSYIDNNFVKNSYLNSNYYTSTVSDNKYALKTSLSNYYTSTESDNKYALKTSLSNYYTKLESDDKYIDMTYLTSNYYNSSYINTYFVNKTFLSSNYYTKDNIKTINCYLYSATFRYSSWSGSSSYTQMASLYAIDGGPTVTSSSLFAGPAMCEQTGNLETNKTLIEALGIINSGRCILGSNIVTITVSEKPTSDIEVIFLIKKGSI